MAKENNLKPVRSTEEARRRGRNGGIKSGESRRNKRDCQNVARMLLDLPVQKDLEKNLAAIGIKQEDYTNRVALLARMMLKAISGNENAAKIVMNMAGENPFYALEERRFEHEVSKDEHASNFADDWIASIPDDDVCLTPLNSRKKKDK